MTDERLKKAIHGLIYPTDLYDQIDSVCYNIFHEADLIPYYDAMRGLPERINAAIIYTFMAKDTNGYRAAVLRMGYTEFKSGRFVNRDMPARVLEDLND